MAKIRSLQNLSSTISISCISFISFKHNIYFTDPPLKYKGGISAPRTSEGCYSEAGPWVLPQP